MIYTNFKSHFLSVSCEIGLETNSSYKSTSDEHSNMRENSFCKIDCDSSVSQKFITDIYLVEYCLNCWINYRYSFLLKITKYFFWFNDLKCDVNLT